MVIKGCYAALYVTYTVGLTMTLAGTFEHESETPTEGTMGEFRLGSANVADVTSA